MFFSLFLFPKKTKHIHVHLLKSMPTFPVFIVWIKHLQIQAKISQLIISWIKGPPNFDAIPATFSPPALENNFHFLVVFFHFWAVLTDRKGLKWFQPVRPEKIRCPTKLFFCFYVGKKEKQRKRDFSPFIIDLKKNKKADKYIAGVFSFQFIA